MGDFMDVKGKHAAVTTCISSVSESQPNIALPHQFEPQRCAQIGENDRESSRSESENEDPEDYREECEGKDSDTEGL